MRCWWVWWLLIWTGCAGAADSVIAIGEVAGTGRVNISRKVADLRDLSGRREIGEVAAAGMAARFVPVRQEHVNFGYDRAHHWLRFAIDPGPGRSRLLLEVGLASLDLVELYTPRPGGGFEVQRAGDHIPWHARPVPHRNHVFRIATDAGAPTVYFLRVASANTLTAPLTLWTEEAFARHERSEQLAFGMFYGLLIALFLYNLVVFVSLRDRAYLWYVAYVGNFGMGLFVFDGFAFEYLWPENIWVANHALAFFLCLALMFGALFARTFLDSARQERHLDRGMQGVIAAAGGLAVFAGTGLVFEYGTIMRAISFVAPCGAVFTLWIGVKALLRGFKPARYFLLAWSSLLFFVVLGALRNFALFPANTVATYGLHVGLAFDVVLLSMALTSRIRVLQQGIMDAQRDLLEANARHRGALEARARELAAANQELEAFSHTVAHDLRAPLRAMDGFASLLKLEHQAVLPASAQRDAEQISRSARRMAALVDGLLEFSRLGRTDPVNGQVSMQAVVASVLEEIVDRSAAAVTVGRLPAVSGDPVLLRQVWANLIGNAVKFSARAEEPAIAIDARIENGAVVFSVTDNGVGFDAAYAGKLFGMFQRLHAATDFDGTGVGLATVRRIVERHGGQVAAASAPEGGARFEFSLPAWRLLEPTRG